MKRILIGILTAGTAALTLAAAPAYAHEECDPRLETQYGYGPYGREFREHERYERYERWRHRERMRRLWLWRHGYQRDWW